MAKQAETAKKKTKAFQPLVPPEERLRIIEKICELYESQDATIESCCVAVGISDRTLRLWVAQDAVLAARYKKAKERQLNFFWEEVLVPLAPRSFARLLKGEKKVKVEEQGANTIDNEGGSVFVVKKVTTTTDEILPNAAVTIFAMKGIYPERFAKDDTPSDIHVTFTDESKHGFDEPGEPEQ